MFSFASWSYWPISEGKKNLIREFCYREEEIHGEKERKKTVKERDLWEEERPNLVTVTVWDEKK